MDRKEHYKMYKDGKKWFFAGIVAFSIGIGFTSVNNAHADAVNATDSTVSIVEKSSSSSASSGSSSVASSAVSSSSDVKASTVANSANASSTVANSSVASSSATSDKAVSSTTSSADKTTSTASSASTSSSATNSVSSSASTSVSSSATPIKAVATKKAAVRMVAADAAAPGLTTTKVSLSGQDGMGTISGGGTASLTNSARLQVTQTVLNGEINGDGTTTQYTIPITVTNVGADSTGSFGPSNTPSDVLDSATGAVIGNIIQNGDFVGNQYNGSFLITLNQPLTSDVSFQTSESGAGVFNALNSSTPFVVTIGGQTFTVNPSQWDLTTRNDQGFISAPYGIDGNDKSVYFGSIVDDPELYNSLLTSGGTSYDENTNLPNGPVIVTQTISKVSGANISGITIGNQGTHTLRISADGTYILTNTNSNIDDLDEGIDSGITPTLITVANNLNSQQVAQILATSADSVDGNTYAISKQSDGSYVVAFNYGDLINRSGFNSDTYFNNQVATDSDEVQEVNRTATVNSAADTALSTSNVVKGAVFSNYQNDEVTFDAPVTSTTQTVYQTYYYGTTTTDPTNALRTFGNSQTPTAPAAPKPVTPIQTVAKPKEMVETKMVNEQPIEKGGNKVVEKHLPQTGEDENNAKGMTLLGMIGIGLTALGFKRGRKED